MNTENLLITPKNKIEIWKNVVEQKIKEGEKIILVIDTETTGGVMKGKGCSVIEKEDPKYIRLRHRVVELGAVVCILNKDTGLIEQLQDPMGEPIVFQEYINFMNEENDKLNKYLSIREMAHGAWFVHGISMDFLKGSSCLGEDLDIYKKENYGVPLPRNHKKTLKLKRSAPTFSEIVEPFMAICGLQYDYKNNPTTGRVYFLAHNHEFDAKFLNSEMANAGQPPIEGLTIGLDSIVLAKGLFSKEYIKEFKENKAKEMHDKLKESKMNEAKIKQDISAKIPAGLHSLNSLSYVLKERGLMDLNGIDRELHGAALDCEILRRVVQAMFSSKEYQTAPNKPPFSSGIDKFVHDLIINKNENKRDVKKIPSNYFQKI